MHDDRTDNPDSPAVQLPISEHERQVLWHLASFVVATESGKLVDPHDDGARVAMSWESAPARRILEDWFRLLDDLGWDKDPQATERRTAGRHLSRSVQARPVSNACGRAQPRPSASVCGRSADANASRTLPEPRFGALAPLVRETETPP